MDYILENALSDPEKAYNIVCGILAAVDCAYDVVCEKSENTVAETKLSDMACCLNELQKIKEVYEKEYNFN